MEDSESSRSINMERDKEKIVNHNSNSDALEELHCNKIEVNIKDVTKDELDAVVKSKGNSLEESQVVGFKKPILVGPKRGKTGKVHVMQEGNEKICTSPIDNIQKQSEEMVLEDYKCERKLHMQQVLSSPKDIPLPYTEPSWGGKPEKKYTLEVLKSGLIIETIDLNEKSFHVVGRLPSCDISLAHPTISRYHAVFQYRAHDDEKNSIGLYLYDLGSTHGTFWNGNRIRPNMYVRLRGGHMIKFGCSHRKLILQAPPEDEEEESELSVTQLKEKRMLELQERDRLEKESLQQEEEARLKREEEEKNQGIDWGMGEDADEETDMTENPYASTNHEEFFLTDPKKTLRGWFEREGYDLQYQTEERGIGQFLCWVDLPIEEIIGHSIRAEALVKGKKKESVIQCALEACRILDRHGLLRQANHEARKRKSRNWEEEDYYDSDEDNFLDRTGTVEKKREQRMRLAGKLETKVETYSSLLEKHNEVVKQIAHFEKCLQNSKKMKMMEDEGVNEDALDAFMSTLNSSALSKSDFIKMKLDLQHLKKEEAKLIELVNLAKPANLPPLTVSAETVNETSRAERSNKKSQNLISNIGQRKKLPPLANKKGNSRFDGTLDLLNPNNDDNVNANVESENEDSETEEIIGQGKEENVNRSSEDQNKEKEIGTDQVSKNTAENSKSNIQNQENASATRISTEALLEKTGESDNNHDKKFNDVKQKKQHAKKAKKLAENIGKGYEPDVYRDDYSMWVPPENQTGDGKTNLNDKYGY